MSEKTRIQLHQTIRDFFQELVGAAVSHQGLRTHDLAVGYLTDLLCEFTRVEALYDEEKGLASRPLALLLAEALQATPDMRIPLFKKLGDFSLYISGFFADSLNRKLVDVGYYIGIGEGAYANVSDLLRLRRGGADFADLFAELARKFQKFVDVFAEVSEQGDFASNRGTLRLYEKWRRTSSERIERELREHGVLKDEPPPKKILQ